MGGQARPRRGLCPGSGIRAAPGHAQTTCGRPPGMARPAAKAVADARFRHAASPWWNEL